MCHLLTRTVIVPQVNRGLFVVCASAICCYHRSQFEGVLELSPNIPPDMFPISGEILMSSLFLRGFAAALLLSSSASSALAKPRVSANTNYYSIAGTTAAQLKAQMRSKGPNGKWAWTKWYVRWTGSCKTSVTITYTYPRWANRNQAPASLQKSWDRMMANLRTHEKGHTQHGINAAAEIERTRCKGNPMSIIKKWAQRDKTYDSRTRSGATQGGVLP